MYQKALHNNASSWCTVGKAGTFLHAPVKIPAGPGMFSAGKWEGKGVMKWVTEDSNDGRSGVLDP